MTKHIKNTQADLDVLDGKSIEDIKSVAEKYEHPDFPEIGIIEEFNWCKELAPLDEASKNRENGATTFNYCGWCKYCEPGIRYHNCYITTTCSLIPKGPKNDGSFRYNTPCAIANGTEELLEECVEYLKFWLTFFNTKKAKIDEYIKLITDAMKQAEEKPVFADFRSLDYFKIGDEVVYYIANGRQDVIKKGVFVTGKIVDGLDHGHGRIYVCTDEQIRARSNKDDGRVVNLDLWRPEVVHKWEYEYLKTHPDFLEVWVKEGADELNVDSHELTEAFLGSAI